MKDRAATMLLPILLVAGCNLLETDSSGPTEARIVFSRGVDGVRFGDSKDEVREKLGAPDSGGIADGLRRNWFVYDYRAGPHAGLSVWFVEEPINTAGPVDLFTVRDPYAGKTQKGIGIDSPVSEVRTAYGEPKNLYEANSTDDGAYTYVYCVDGKRLQIGFKGDRVAGIGLGYYESHPNDVCRYSIPIF